MNITEDSTSGVRSSGSEIVAVAAILLIPLVLFAVLGNVLILYAVCLKPRFSRPANFMLANLSMTSLLQMSSMLSGLLHKNYPFFTYGPWTCHLFPVIHTLAIPAEGFTVMCISLERSRKSMRPLERESGEKVVKKIAGIWIASIIIDLPHGLFWHHHEDALSHLKCVEVKELLGSKIPYIVYAWSYFLVTNILPISFMLRESILLASRLKFLISLKHAEWTQYQVCQYKLIRNALLFMVIFCCLKLPAGLVWFFTRLPPENVPESVRNWASAWKIILFRIGALNVSVYPLITFSLGNKMWKLLPFCEDAPNRPLLHPLYLMHARGQPVQV